MNELTRSFGEFSNAHAVPSAVQKTMNIALDELVANALSHGRAQEVILEAEIVGDRVKVILTDDGRAFDPFARNDPDTKSSVSLRPIGGLGVYLVKQMMDDVAYRRDNKRNIVTLEKLL